MRVTGGWQLRVGHAADAEWFVYGQSNFIICLYRLSKNSFNSDVTLQIAAWIAGRNHDDRKA